MHPVVEEVISRKVVSEEELKRLMKRHGRDPRGIGGLSNSRQIVWIAKTRSWKPGITHSEFQ
ncbi:hypothetical protein M3221_07240 [Domibacillus indicus]|uniref:hypothetical protein n=1 Tax=Domibacillus indicus TaxID=1437523 RepID=UPI00203ABF98|nr:hypothetical protein [Domibacillus indicus]MCM3788194.1 hypothetical protein [Domibacillus indicus]